MKILLELIDVLFTATTQLITDIFETDHHVHASFAKASKLISKSSKGFCIDGKRFLSLQTSRLNMCVVAGSGKGKTQVHIFPTLLNLQSSAVVNDNSGELAKTIPYLESRGIKCLVMNLRKMGDVFINPIQNCQADIAAMRKISKTLLGNTTKEDDFFSLSAEDCITLFIQFVLESFPKLQANLANVYRLILEYQGNPKAIEYLMAEKASPEVWSRFLALAGNSEKTLKSITATALSALSWLGENPTLASLTSVSNISFEDFRKYPHILFIQYPASDTKFFAPMVSLMFQSFYRFAFSELPKEDDLDILMILDEFSSLSKGLPDYSQIISNSRKFKIPQLLILQDESLLSPYGAEKDNILGNCFVKCYYGGQDKKSFELEKLLGNFTYQDSKTNSNKTRPLLYASQIRELKDEILVITSGEKPLKLKVTPAYRQARLVKKLEMSPSQSNDPLSAAFSVQYFDLEPYRNQTQN